MTFSGKSTFFMSFQIFEGKDNEQVIRSPSKHSPYLTLNNDKRQFGTIY